MGYNIKVMDCNGLCGSCYENKIREREGKRKYDVEKIVKRFREESEKVPPEQRKKRATPCFHGGEPLLVKLDDFAYILKTMYELWGRTTIQTNGLLLKDKHIELFKEYGTHVGFSLDGDTAHLNFGRWNAAILPLSRIEESTRLVLKNMAKCVDAGLTISVISVLRTYNASREQLPNFIKFLLRLRDEFKCTSVRTNAGIVYDKSAFSIEELHPVDLAAAYTTLADVCLSDGALNWQPYRDVVDLMLGHMFQTCVFTECDIWNTESETTIDEEGNLGNCLKGGGSIDGIRVLADPRRSDERYRALEQIAQEQGGCKDCEFWRICKGGCPGEGLDNDWRNKTRFCHSWKVLFKHIESKMSGLLPNLLTISKNPVFPSPNVALANLHTGGSSWRGEKRMGIDLLKTLHKEANTNYGDCPHGDHMDRPDTRK